MSTPVTFEGTATVGTTVLPQFLTQITSDSEADFVFKFGTGAASQSVDFGTIGSAGAKGVLIAYDILQSAAPLQLTFNGGSEPIELAQGGFLIYISPNPVDGVTSLSIAHTTVGTVRVWLLG